MTRTQAPTSGNLLLNVLPRTELDRLAHALRPVALPLRQVLHAPDQPVEHAYFPESGVVSILAALDGGDVMEVGTIGREGMVGLPVVLGVDFAATEASVQVQGSALQIRAGALREAIEASATLRALLLRYAQAFHSQVAQIAACTGRHTVEERLARWLLMAQDRIGGDELPLTQEFLANMLGVRRAGVTVAAGTLQKAGLIQYRHGQIVVLDRLGLEAAACECYRIIERHFQRLFGAGAKG
jgi:CRP-like cAMP-binding protein